MKSIRTLLTLLLTFVVSLSMAQDEKPETYRVLKTSDGQYFVSLPGLGKFAGDSGTGKTMGDAVGPESCLLEECQKWIKENWTDMRPLSLQKKMADEGLSVDDTKLRVVINHEEQYSLTLANDKVPEGWKDTGKVCVLDDCRKYIEEVWTDMRPLSLRKKPGRTK
jgi:MbtH protein